MDDREKGFNLTAVRRSTVGEGFSPLPRVGNVLASGVLMMRAVIPPMKKQRSGSIINTASGVGIRPRPSLAAYCASNGGVIALSKAAATELGDDAIRLNALCPGMIDTEMTRRVIASHSHPVEEHAGLML